MQIRLLTHLTDEQIQRTLLTAIRTCYSYNTPSAIYNGETDDYDKYLKQGQFDRLYRDILRSGHWSVLEHINFTFLIEGVSRAMLAQLTRHRHVSFSVQSQRYTRFTKSSKSGGAKFIVPVNIAASPKMATFQQALNYIQDVYDDLSDGITAEDARAILPNATSTNIVMTLNLRSLIQFTDLRSTKAAQSEIRTFAFMLVELATEAYPVVKKAFEIINEKKTEESNKDLLIAKLQHELNVLKGVKDNDTSIQS